MTISLTVQLDAIDWLDVWANLDQKLFRCLRCCHLFWSHYSVAYWQVRCLFTNVQLGKLGLGFLLGARPLSTVTASNGLLLQMLILCRQFVKNSGLDWNGNGVGLKFHWATSSGRRGVSPPVINPRRATGKELMILEEQTTVLHHCDDRSSHLIRFRRQWGSAVAVRPRECNWCRRQSSNSCNVWATCWSMPFTPLPPGPIAATEKTVVDVADAEPLSRPLCVPLYLVACDEMTTCRWPFFQPLITCSSIRCWPVPTAAASH